MDHRTLQLTSLVRLSSVTVQDDASWIAPQYPLSEWTLMSAVNVAHSINTSSALDCPLDYSLDFSLSTLAYFLFCQPWYETDGLLPGLAVGPQLLPGLILSRLNC